MISLIIPPRDQISRVSKMLADEFGTASNIKSRVNRLSVLGAITSVQHRLKLYTKGDLFRLAPDNLIVSICQRILRRQKCLQNIIVFMFVGSLPSMNIYLADKSVQFSCQKYIRTIYHDSNICIGFSVPPNGLVIYCGTIVTEEGKEKKVNIDFEPFKPINTSLYLCDNKVSWPKYKQT